MFDLDKLKQEAIDFAVEANWLRAIEANKRIIEKEKDNLEAWLRLGFSYLQNGNFSQAEKSYEKALKIQPANQVAHDNLKKIRVINSHGYPNKKNIINPTKYDPKLFLKEPGKTKITTLIKLGQKNVLAKLSIGEKVFLNFKKRKISIKNNQGEYIGCLPDDLSLRLTLFIKAGSVYEAFVKEATLDKVVILIKEIKKGRKVARYVSFPESMVTNIKKLEQRSEDQAGEKEEEDKSELELMAKDLGEEEEEDYSSLLENEPGNGDEDEEE